MGDPTKGRATGDWGRPLVLLAGTGLFVVWIWLHSSRLTADPEGIIRLTLGTFFAFWILMRGKAPDHDGEYVSAARPLVTAVAGTVMAILGLIIPVWQFEWIGIVVLLYACLGWSLPRRWHPDLRLALFILYWIHPLPSRIFGGFEFLLQKASMQGSGWLLQVLDIPVWADGFILHTGHLVFGVPESCSGARTAVTVLMCILGLSAIRRLGWAKWTIFSIAGVFQVLLLNIIRISMIVAMGRNRDQAWAQNILHDTLGIFLLAAIVLIFFEVFLMTHHLERRENRAFKFLPRDMKDLLWGIPRILAIFLLIAAVAYGVQRRRPYRHALLLLEVARALQVHDLEGAERAIREAERLDPANRDILDERLHIMIKRKKYAEVLTAIKNIPEPSSAELVMKAQTLTALDRIEEAYALLKGLPAEAAHWPAVEMIRAEYGAVKDDLPEVLRRVRMASRDPVNAARLRALFPFLAHYEEWNTIAAIESASPHSVVVQALIGVRAYLETEQLDKAEAALQRALSAWPNEPRFISITYELARQRPGRGWDDRFADGVLEHLGKFDTDFLGLYVDYAFDLGRPDVAWAAYRTLADRDASDPALDILVARNAPRWFSFDVVAGTEEGQPLAQAQKRQRLLAAFGEKWGEIPLAGVLRDANVAQLRSEYGQRALENLDKRRAEGRLSDRMLLQYPQVLILLGRTEAAQEHLGGIVEEYPHLKSQARSLSASLYAERGQWDDAYEKLHLVYDADDRPPLDLCLLMLRAASELGRGLTAMDVAKRAHARFPSASEARMGLAAAWLSVNDPAQALLVLEEGDGWVLAPELAQILYETGRIAEAQQMTRRMNVALKGRDKARQELDLDPAEQVLDGSLPSLPPRSQWIAVADSLVAPRDAARSPYDRERLTLEEAWFRSGGTYDAGLWEASGRDNLEQAEALHRLAVLLAQTGQTPESLTVLRRAAAILPSSEGIWRLIVTLDKGDDTIRAALKQCPGDPHIWLASLVARVRSVPPEDRAKLGGWIMEQARWASQGRTCSPETLVRAGTYLMRQGFGDAASVIARSAAARARGLLAAHALEVRCAVASGNADWALTAAHGAIGVALDPEPFFRTIAYIKMNLGVADADARRALQYLVEHAEDGKFWKEKLGIAFFREPDYRRASEILRQVVLEASEEDRLRIRMLIVESDRLLGNQGSVLTTLRQTYQANPDSLEVLNNLVYVLADTPGRIEEAKGLLPRLIAKAGDDFRTLDTIAVVYLRSGDIEAAKTWSAKAVAAAPAGSYHAAETYMHAAEVQYKAGDKKAALVLLETARKQAKLPPVIDRRTRELLWEIQRGPR